MSQATKIEQVFASAARTATPTPVEVSNDLGARQLVVVIDVTAVSATPSVTFDIEGVDPISQQTWTILSSAAVTAVGTTVLRVDDNLTGAANTIAQDIVPPLFQITPTHADADSITYSVSAHLV